MNVPSSIDTSNSRIESKEEKPPQETKELVKVCSECGIEKQITDFVRMARSRSGYRSICKLCFAAKSRAIRQAKYARSRMEILRKMGGLYPDGKKICKFHQVSHDISKFGRDLSNADGLRYSCRRADHILLRKWRQESQAQTQVHS